MQRLGPDAPERAPLTEKMNDLKREVNGLSYATEGKAPMEAACCKYYATEMVGRVADRAVQIHGGAGYMADYAVERFYRDVRLFRIYEGTSQIQQIVIARNLVKAWTDTH